MQWDSELPSDLVEKLWDDPDALLRRHTLQDKLRCTVAQVEHSAGNFVWKRHTWGGIGRTVRRSLSRSAARKSWLDGRFLFQAGVPTPRPRAFLERRMGPFKARSYLLTDYVPGTSLYRFMRFGCPSQQAMQNFARQAAAIWQQLDELRIQHNDFQTENFLVDPQGKLWLIDLERLCRDQRADRARRKQISDLERLLHPRNWRANPEAVELFRQEILKTACGAKALANARGDDHPLNRPLRLVNRASQLVTVLIPCRNAAATILNCLRSVHDMADEILVADAGSTDETLALVREFGGCRIIEAPHLEGTAFEACAQAHARHSWILRILADEQLSPELAREVQYKLATEPDEDGFEVLHTVCFRGQWLQHGGFQSDSSIRLYRKDAGRYLIRDGRVAATVSSKRIGKIPFSITREICPNIHEHLTATMRRAADVARAVADRRTKPAHGRVLIGAIRQFLRSLILQSGWLDGFAGLHASYLSAFGIYLRETMRWEIEHSIQQTASHSSKVCQELKVFDPEGDSILPFAAKPGNSPPAAVEHQQRRAA